MIIVMSDDIFGKNLRRWRRKRRMTQLALALRSGIPCGAIRRFETGQLREVNYDDLLRLNSALGTTTDALIEAGRI